MAAPGELAGLSAAELLRMERAIARQHCGAFPLPIVLWAIGNAACWIALWPLVLSGVLPLWLGFLIAVVNVTLVYLPTHDAQHDIIARPGQRLRWLNEAIGHGTSWILGSSFLVLRHTHLEHHKHANDPALDPDHSTHARGPAHAIWVSIRDRQPDGKRAAAYAAALLRVGRSDLVGHAIAYNLGLLAILSGLAWSGLALEAFLLWWLPMQIASTYNSFFLSWAPHHPATETGRYRDTRGFRSRLGNIGSMGMQFHIVHHLHPYIPLHRTPAAYWEMRPILEARGCKIHDL